MGIFTYCDRCKKDTYHDGMANEGPCSECEARDQRRLENKNQVPIVLTTDSKAGIDKAIELPVLLKCPADGRLFDIIKWEPSVSVGKAITAKVEVIIRVPSHPDNAGNQQA